MSEKMAIGKEMYDIAEQLFSLGVPCPKESSASRSVVGVFGKHSEARQIGHAVFLGVEVPMVMKMIPDDGKIYFYAEGNQIRFSISRDGDVEVKIRRYNEVIDEDPKKITEKVLTRAKDEMQELLELNQNLPEEKLEKLKSSLLGEKR